MLPKVANHLLHHTARAISVAQNQTGHTIRNVLQLQSSSTPSTASGNFGGWNGASSSHSNWNGRGAGSGGAKFHPGGRSYAGYTGAGRAVTQAETISVNDLSQSAGDDSDDIPPGLRRGAHSPKSHGSSLPPRARSRAGLTVVRTVQSHTKSNRPFGGQVVVETSSTNAGLSTQATALLLHRLSARDVTARPYSTASNVQTVSDYLDVESPPSSSASLQHSDASYSRPPSPASSLPTPPPEDVEEAPTNETADYKAFEHAAQNKDAQKVHDLVESMHSRATRPSVQLYNAALSSLRAVRSPHQSLRYILELYNAMLARSIAPNFKTYTTLIQAFTERDRDVQEALQRLERNVRWQTTLGGTESIADRKRISNLRAENNLRPAMTLFQTACAIPHTKMPRVIYHGLLESCANHANVDAAIHVFAHLERRRDILPTARTFHLLMSVYTALADWQSAKDVFEEFRQACKSGRIGAVLDIEGSAEETHRLLRLTRINVWNAMLEAYVRSGQHTAALGLLEQMLDTKAGEAFDVADVPPPSPGTFHRLIASFCQSGEIGTALAWFDRLLLQDVAPRSPDDASVSPCRPNSSTWASIIEAVCLDGRIDDLMRVMSSFERLADQDNLMLHRNDIYLVLQTYFRHLSLHPNLEEAQVVSITDAMSTVIARYGPAVLRCLVNDDKPRELCVALPHLLLSKGRAKEACRLVLSYVAFEGQERGALSEEVTSRRKAVRDLVLGFCRRCCTETDGKLSLQEVIGLGRLFWVIREAIPADVAAWSLQAYAAARSNADELRHLTLDDWTFVAFVVPEVEGIVAVEDVLGDMERIGMKLTSLPTHSRIRLFTRLRDQRDESYASETMHRYDPEAEHILNLVASKDANRNNLVELAPPSEDSPAPPLAKVQHPHSAFVSEFWPIPNARISPAVAYQRFEAGRARNVYPYPVVLSRLITTLGRDREIEKVRTLYDSAQLVLQTYEHNKEEQSYAWFLVEDSMVIALAHGGELDAAHVHRARIIEHGGVPTADAYGALIHNVKDTTDDASSAIALYRESRERGVIPNVFLYNTMISKLAKARKADDAIALFKEMKASAIHPSSVTYGAVIAACCRVGDVASAETLFTEMAAQPSFRPRVPPYNTMMQLYTSTRPDRARALHYFDQLVAARVKPSAHTYKLLLDAYGSIEPVDSAAMERVFGEITSGRKPLIQGTHWASFIHSVGCVQKDLDRALALFDSVASHPSTRQSGAQLPDAVVFESLINVLAAHRRVDLIPGYVSQLRTYGIHMTAYIANLLIKAYASAGDIERSREIFDSLADPPEGIAAPHNHAPHDAQSSDISQVPVDAPVYREPSTWEAMVRAELGHRNRDEAIALLDRAQARQFPPAVLNRISGILLDDSVSPWAEPE
ncbi:uncharacterized protein B0H18DRAFT_1213255 [Fomitopsis serialis]|uniref:uncharacterized protein n=1 Tax=Fomitopsis serialis TaxID=139415 RepID=UPI002007960E|nr:uncharacterized protein B0H18DRAFT_1213255 [Neoantrodia serialis]KAH9920796.1 hypothetical protein B0H18DRAFT_1213255 [Neoantrodia serialis]